MQKNEAAKPHAANKREKNKNCTPLNLKIISGFEEQSQVKISEPCGMMRMMNPQNAEDFLETSTQPEPLPAHRRKRLEEPPRTAIIGGGPLGLEAALYAKRLGHTVFLFERDPEVAPDVRAWASVTMFTNWEASRSSLGELALREDAAAKERLFGKLPAPSLHLTGQRFIDRYLQPVAATLGTSVHLETRVAAVGRSFLFAEEHAADPEKRAGRRFRILTRTPLDERVFTADYILDASGVTHTPRWAGAGGLPAMGEMGSFRQIFHDIPDVLGRDRIHFLGKRVLLIGDGTSAATVAVALAELHALDPATTVLWVSPSRAPAPFEIIPNDPLPLRDTLLKKANLLVETKAPGIEYSPVTQVEALQHSLAHNRFQVTLQVNHETRRLTVDSVVSAVGSRPDARTYEKALHPEERDFYTLGQKSVPSGDFFFAQGRTQIQDIFRQITAQPELDLYADAQQQLDALHAAEAGVTS